MLYEKIMGVSKALSVLGGQVSDEQWSLIKMAKDELMDAADQAQNLESELSVSRVVSGQARRREFFEDAEASQARIGN
jgi:hypothetical protein